MIYLQTLSIVSYPEIAPFTGSCNSILLLMSLVSVGYWSDDGGKPPQRWNASGYICV